ncbi:sulfite exporter TauE/SafE family protein [Streptomyces sp. LHD-70]|uniref:sulfite exporter TauE/SafE family protein n=1 Tax=Streptomyces sp. LHD-70 TaxID=3072140 RepID=UPI00280F9959|nr:sulfite exporter TauE/SafE family protein [Streptomyces sp. LHD-70]MDQ8702862.1 sulfite exporter TauE/SafE family protein [Streptomyces sp. LHD-70]
MRTLILLALAGLGAQLVDGSLGMAYGVTSTTLLLAFGTNPAAASATVHLAEIGTTLASGVAHWRFGNVDWRVVAKIGLPGAVGAFAGATVLSNLSTELAEPVMALILLGLGAYVLTRFTFLGLPTGNLNKPLRKRFLSPLGVVAGFLDATGGGGWGPVGTPAILASGRLEPRKVIGSVDTSEFLVAVAASLGFLFGLGSEGVDLAWAGALLVGGLIAAPIAAWLVRHVPPRLLGSAVGGVIVLTNIRTLLKSDWLNASDSTQWVVYALIYVLWAAAVAHSFREHRKQTRIAPEAKTAAKADAGTDTGTDAETAPETEAARAEGASAQTEVAARTGGGSSSA